MKRLSLVAGLLGLAGCPSAAAIDLGEVGAELGWSSHTQSWDWKGAALYDPDDRISGLTGGVYVARGRIRWSWLGARGQLCYNRRGASRYTADYLSVPLLATFQPPSGGKLRVTFALGPGAEFLLRDEYDLPHLSGVVAVDPTSNMFDGFNIGGYARVGVTSPSFGVWVQYYRDLTSPIKQAYSDSGLPESVKNSGVSLILSARIAGA